MTTPSLLWQPTRRSSPLRLLVQRLLQFNWALLALILLFGGIGFVALYAADGGVSDGLAGQYRLRFMLGLAGCAVTAMITLRFWLILAYPFYLFCLTLLASVEVMGITAMGATRWIDLGFMTLQPSEPMKIALILALARYGHRLRQDEAGDLRHLILPTLLIALPFLLIYRQPDLGTGLLLILSGLAVLFVSGLRWRLIIITLLLLLLALPLGWRFALEDYQRQRIETYLNPESDPLGAGYHIVQSKIALGSGGLTGKGFLNGRQSQLNYVPEKHTDFIFALWAEEWGFRGAIFLLGLYALLLGTISLIALRARSSFARLLGLGISFNLFLYVAVNIGMVIGLLPVVGVPLVMISHGGTVLLTTLFALGLVMSIWIDRDEDIKRRAHAWPVLG